MSTIHQIHVPKWPKDSHILWVAYFWQPVMSIVLHSKTTKWFTVKAVSSPQQMCDFCNCNHGLSVCAYARWSRACIHVCLEMTQALLVWAGCTSWLGPNWTPCFNHLIANRRRWVYYNIILLFLLHPLCSSKLMSLETHVMHIVHYSANDYNLPSHLIKEVAIRAPRHT